MIGDDTLDMLEGHARYRIEVGAAAVSTDPETLLELVRGYREVVAASPTGEPAGEPAVSGGDLGDGRVRMLRGEAVEARVVAELEEAASRLTPPVRARVGHHAGYTLWLTLSDGREVFGGSVFHRDVAFLMCMGFNQLVAAGVDVATVVEWVEAQRVRDEAEGFVRAPRNGGT